MSRRNWINLFSNSQAIEQRRMQAMAGTLPQHSPAQINTKRKCTSA